MTPPSARPGPALGLGLALASVGALLGATVACSLNPQPLPPGDDDRIAAEPTGAPSAGGNFSDAEASPRDAGAPPPSPDASPGLDAAAPDASRDGGDASPDGGDASVDGGDASPDATRD